MTTLILAFALSGKCPGGVCQVPAKPAEVQTQPTAKSGHKAAKSGHKHKFQPLRGVGRRLFKRGCCG